MSTMQEFYAQLFQEPETEDSDWAALAQLTQATVSELSALESRDDWSEW